jgi:phosphatidylserine/phosphatidylglycerophosphate/cardiolipin synthase-like enzyme
MLGQFQYYLGEAWSWVKSKQYLIDHTVCCNILLAKTIKGLNFKLLLDKTQFFSSSCARQAPRMVEFYRHGVEMRYLHPGGSGFASQHSKSFLIDGRVYMTGSVNLTHGGLEHNVEDLLVVTDGEVLSKAEQVFDTQWDRATPVSDRDMQRMTETWERREAVKKKEGRRSVSRSLSLEFGDDSAAAGSSSGAAVS